MIGSGSEAKGRAFESRRARHFSRLWGLASQAAQLRLRCSTQRRAARLGFLRPPEAANAARYVIERFEMMRRD
jgi:hypothetical protein